MADGRLQAFGDLDLGTPGEGHVKLQFRHLEADAAAVGEILGMRQDRLTGELAAMGTLEGPLRPDARFTEVGKIDLDVEIEDGTLGKGPLTVTLARLASLQGWTGLFGRPLPFDTLDTSLRVEKGTLHIEDFNLVGPELRILSAGRMELHEEGLPVDLLVALLLFNPVDWVIGTVPVIGDWVLGEDGSLVALYFKLLEDGNGSSFSSDAEDAFRDPNASLPLMILGIGILPGIFEELGFRGWMQSAWKLVLPSGRALILTACAFTVIHFSYYSIGWLLPFALYLGWLRERSGSIWPGVIAHMGHNTAMVLFVRYSG